MPVAGNTKWTKDEIVDAINGDGVFTRPDGESVAVNGTVKAICARLQITRPTWYKYVAEWPELDYELQKTKEVQLDITEEKLFEAIHDGHFPAIKLHLETVGHRRGYGRRTLLRADINASGDPFEDMSDEELDAILADGDDGE